MKGIRRILGIFAAACLLMTVAACGFSSSHANAFWSGELRYEGPALQDAGGVNIAETIVLYLDADGGCRIERLGQQVDEVMICEQVPKTGRLDLLFLHYANGKQSNDYGVAVYALREPLLSLLGQRDSPSHLAEWGTLMPDAGTTGSFGQFRRTTSKLSTEETPDFGKEAATAKGRHATAMITRAWIDERTRVK